MMKSLSLVAFLAAFCTPTDVLAHSWYPVECCSGYDCDVAGPASTNAFGDLVVTDGKRHLVIPDTVPRHRSPDNNVHLCYNRDEIRYGKPLEIYCVYLPSPGLAGLPFLPPGGRSCIATPFVGCPIVNQAVAHRFIAYAARRQCK